MNKKVKFEEGLVSEVELCTGTFDAFGVSACGWYN